MAVKVSEHKEKLREIEELEALLKNLHTNMEKINEALCEMAAMIARQLEK